MRLIFLSSPLQKVLLKDHAIPELTDIREEEKIFFDLIWDVV